MAARKEPADLSVVQIKVTLKHSSPPIWRRIQVPSKTTLGRFHQILQVVMGWHDCHLHQFIMGGTYYSDPDSFDDWEDEIENERPVKLSQVIFGPKTRFTYEYDMGDGWEHEILIEKILPPQEGVRYPVCLDGKRACPPEDCGGMYGYYDLLETIQNPNHPAHKEMLEWVGGSFDPEAFDLDRVNKLLRKTK